MCEFLSWIEKGDKVYFLTKAQIDSPQGEAVKKRFPGEGELIGHSAIRAYYDIDGGKEKEQTDFSSPDNFPKEIIEAILKGKFGYIPVPKGILKKPLDDKYSADQKPLDDKYSADQKLLNDKYSADRKPLDDKYWADRKLLNDKYWADRKPLDDKYWADRKLLNDKYWALIQNPKNRSKNWACLP